MPAQWMSPIRPRVAALLGAAALVSCAPATTPGTPARDAMVPTGAEAGALAIPPLPLPPPVRPDPATGESGLAVRLREGATGALQDAPDPAGPALSAADPLAPARTAQLLARLPPLPAAETTAFRFPSASPPPPRTGRVVLTPFPPSDTAAEPPPAVTQAALEVVRIVPAGTTELAPHLTITFSDAMVPLTTVAGTEARTPPVRLTPQPPGHWSWIDVRTLRFEPEDRFPMATSFLVEVPGGTRSAAGAALARPVRADFNTPAPRAIGAYPALHPDTGEAAGDPRLRRQVYGRSEELALAVGLQPVVLIAFDQRVDPAAVVRAARMIADGGPRALRLAAAAEVAADTVVNQIVQEMEDGRWIAVRPVEPLPAGADVRVVLEAGLPSLEGPRTTVAPQELRFRTHGPLRIVAHGCGEETCRPGMPWSIQLSNLLDANGSSTELVSVEPALEHISVRIYGSQINIVGAASPDTTYVVTLSPQIRDQFGQQLEAPRSVSFQIGPRHPVARMTGAPLIVLDPEGPPRLAVQSYGYRTLRVRVYRVAPEQWLDYAIAVQRWQQEPFSQLLPPGELVASTTVTVAGEPGEFSETLIDVGPALADGLGHAIVTVAREDTVAPDAVAGPPDTVEPLRFRSPLHAWVQSTHIGLAATADSDELFVWASSLRSGLPLAGAVVELLPTGRETMTTREGIAQLPLSTAGDGVVIARSGADAALLPANPYPRRQSSRYWQRRGSDQLRWHVLTDRGLYQPGETVHLKGWLRQLRGTGPEELELAEGVDAVDLTLRGPRREELATRMVNPGELGGFSATFELPGALNLGSAGIELQASGPDVPDDGNRKRHTVRVQEFRRPEYEVRAEADPGPHVVGGVIDVMLNADYYSGGGLAGAPLEWRVTTRPGSYRPPGWDRWHFGPVQSWRDISRGTHTLSGMTDAAGAHRLLIDLLDVNPPFPTSLRAEAQVLDLTRQMGSAAVDLLVHPADVTAGLRLERSWIHRGQSTTLHVIVVDHGGAAVSGLEVEVMLERVPDRFGARDTARAEDARVVCRMQSGTAPAACSFTPDSAGAYRVMAEVRDAAARPTRSEMMLWVAGTPGAPDPRSDPARIELIADREEYQPGDTARILVQAPFHPAEALVTIRGRGVLSRDRVRIETQSHELTLPITEEHIPNTRVRVELVDAERGVNYGAGEVAVNVPPHRRALDVRVTPRDTLSLPGADVTIDVEVRAPDGRPAAGADVTLWMVDEAILALGGYLLGDPLDSFYQQRSGYRYNLESRQWVVRWPQSAGPGTFSGIVLTSDAGRALPGAEVRLQGTGIVTRTAFDGGFTLRGIAPGDYVLEVISPDGTTGRREVTVPAEGVHIGNLVLRESGLAAAREVQLAEEQLQFRGFTVVDASMQAMSPLRVSLSMDGNDAQDVELRTDFAPLAFFEPSLRTDADGRLQFTARLPQSLTRYRIMAVAVSGAQHFGTGEAALTARRDLMVRLAAPQFLNYGDTFELPVLVQNVTARPMTVEVAARAAGAEIRGPAGRTLALGPGARAEVRFDAAAPLPGTAHLQVVAVATDGGTASDASAVAVPVYTPATSEAFATYGTMVDDDPVVLPLAQPDNVIAGFGGLEVSITATALHSLTDAVLYLHRYPFGGAEHLASHVIAVAALRDVLAAFGAEGLPGPDTLIAAAERDIARLAGMQGQDGGWPFWSGAGPSHPFVSIHVTHALQRARERGLAVPRTALERAAEYLRTIDSHVAEWPHGARQSAAAYSLYVRHRMGDPATIAEARRLASAAPVHVGGELSVEAAGWLLYILASDPASRAQAESLHRALLNRLVETAGTVTFAARYDDGEHLLLHSRRRSDAVLLEALIAANADADVVTRLARSLLAHRVAGRWSGTQENAWVLLALDRYFRTYEATTPAFASRVWFGDRFAGGHAFEGRTTERQHIDIPMPELLRSDAEELTITREGSGRMYYRAGVRYAPADLRMPPADRGFQVSRVYEAVDDTADVQRDDDGTWRVRAGARVRVRVSMVAPSVRYHAALVDPMPAGFQPLNPELRGTGFTDDPAARGLVPRRTIHGPWRPTWFEHQNLREDRAEAFAALLPAGAYEYTYLARATTPGTFNVPPPRAEMMYEPETFGRGAGSTVVIEK